MSKLPKNLFITTFYLVTFSASKFAFAFAVAEIKLVFCPKTNFHSTVFSTQTEKTPDTKAPPNVIWHAQNTSSISSREAIIAKGAPNTPSPKPVHLFCHTGLDPPVCS